MGYNAAPLEKLIEEFSKFPGIGRKGATRMAYQVLSMSDAIQNAHTKLHRCRVCQNYTEAELCPICASAKRDRSVICVVETPRDVQAFERTREYHGMYHVLHGLISPMDGIGAEQLTVKELLARLGDGEVKEVIMAMNPTVEGEATPISILKLLKSHRPCIWQSSSSPWASRPPVWPMACPWVPAWSIPMRRPCTGRCLAGENCDQLYFKALRLRAGLCAVYGIKKKHPAGEMKQIQEI